MTKNQRLNKLYQSRRAEWKRCNVEDPPPISWREWKQIEILLSKLEKFEKYGLDND